jgi:hypothetical protein
MSRPRFCSELIKLEHYRVGFRIVHRYPRECDVVSDCVIVRASQHPFSTSNSFPPDKDLGRISADSGHEYLAFPLFGATHKKLLDIAKAALTMVIVAVHNAKAGKEHRP